MLRAVCLILLSLLILIGPVMAKPDHRAKQPAPLHSDDPETEAGFAPWTEFFNEMDERQQAGTLPPKEEIIQRWKELEKKHGPLPIERLGRSKERNSVVPRI
jgi:hypothetical protein